MYVLSAVPIDGPVSNVLSYSESSMERLATDNIFCLCKVIIFFFDKPFESVTCKINFFPFLGIKVENLNLPFLSKFTFVIGGGNSVSIA